MFGSPVILPFVYLVTMRMVLNFKEYRRWVFVAVVVRIEKKNNRSSIVAGYLKEVK